MPRSIDPRNYGPFYDKLAELMDRGEHEIRLTLPLLTAIYHRNNFYAYINAWKHKAQSIPRDKTIPDDRRAHLLEQAIRREDVLRKYLVVIDELPDMLDHVELRFIIRGMDERQVEPIKQLEALLEQSKGLSLEDVKTQLSPIDYKTIDPATLRADDSPIAHFFSGVKTEVDPDMTDELADEILHATPVDPTDMSALITPSNQPEPPAPNYQDQVTKDLKKLRDKERK